MAKDERKFRSGDTVADINWTHFDGYEFLTVAKSEIDDEGTEWLYLEGERMPRRASGYMLVGGDA